MDRSEILRSLLLLLAIIIACTLAANLSSGFLLKLAGIDIKDVLNGVPLEADQRILFRLGLMVNHAGTFLIPGIIYSYIFLKKDSFQFLKLNQKLHFNSLLLWGLTILFSYPLIAQLTVWNLTIPLPEWMSSSQSNAFALLEQTLKMESPLELIISMLLIGVMASIGEELIFRGILQGRLLQYFKNPHKAILLAAIIFGAFHMQFERIIPLSLLGLILGYSYYYSRTLWVPLILHFLNNSLQVLSIYAITKKEEMPDISNVPDIHYSVVIISVLLTITLAYLAIRQSLRPDEQRP